MKIFAGFFNKKDITSNIRRILFPICSTILS